MVTLTQVVLKAQKKSHNLSEDEIRKIIAEEITKNIKLPEKKTKLNFLGQKVSPLEMSDLGLHNNITCKKTKKVSSTPVEQHLDLTSMKFTIIEMYKNRCQKFILLHQSFFGF